MKIIVAGMTPIGVEVAAVLAGRGHEITVIDRDPRNLAVAEERLDALILQAYEGTAETLRKAHAEHADLVVYATHGDELNLFAGAAARRLGARRTLAMVRNMDHLEGAPGIARGVHGVDYVLCPVLLTAAEAHRLAHARRAVRQAFLADNRITVEEIEITSDDPVAGGTVDRIGLPASVRLLALVRGGAWVPAGPRERLQVGDRVVLVGRRGAMLRAERRFQPGALRALRHAFVVGGGRIGLHVGRAFLAEGVDVTLIERDLERCERRARDLPEATILHGDGTHVELLQQEGGASADVLVAGTQDDETNLVVSLLAAGIGTSHTVTLVHRARNIGVYSHLGLPATVSRPLVAAREAARLAHSGPSVDAVEVASGLLLALELRIAPGSRLEGRTLADAGLPVDALPAFVLHGAQVQAVTLSTRLCAGDHLILLVPPARRRMIEAAAAAGGSSQRT